ncbi:MAG: 2'-5' RNA ligase family protein [Pyrinomonadaceae bacterium]|nr:2'-5' RNA ligase family protein [Pyrinomonadaceae bacterium]
MSFVLTLKFDDETFATLDDLRREHFPPERNFVSAHSTLFHALPDDEQDFIEETLTEIALKTGVLELHFPNLLFLGKGTAIELICPRLVQLRGQLSNYWRDFLGEQDSRKIKLHVTIQNKVEPETAKQTFAELSETFKPFDGRGEGVLFWRYLQTGRWEFVQEFLFVRKPTNDNV